MASKSLGRVFAIFALLLAQLAAAQDAGKQETRPVAPLEAYGAMPGIADVAISDSGKFLAVFINDGGESRIVMLGEDLALQRQIGANDTKFRGFRFIGDEALLIYTSTTVELRDFVAERYEMTQVISLPVDPARNPVAVFGENRALNNAIHGNFGVCFVDGSWRGYYGALEFRRSARGYVFNHGRPFLYEFDFDAGQERRVALAPDQNFFRDWLMDADGEIAATFDMNRLSGTWEIRNADDDRIASGSNRNGRAGLIGLGGDGTSLIYFSEDEAGERTEWFELPLAGGEAAPFLDAERIARVYWERNSGRYLGHQLDEEGDPQVFADPHLQSRAQMIATAFAGQNANIVDWSEDMGKAIVHTSGNRDSGTWFLVDVEELRAEPIGYDRPQIAGAAVGQISTIDYVAEDGLELDGILTLPPGRDAAQLPLVVIPHGGPHSRDDERFDWLAQAFASRGYAVFQPNFRGSTGRDDAFRRASYGEWGRKMQTDISEGVAVLAQQGIIDPQRACIVGASYGGYAALAGVTLQQGIYRCAVSLAGISDIQTWYSTERRESPGSRLQIRSLREELGDSGNWDAISPRRFADRVSVPILLLHGLDDTVVHYEQSSLMADALDDAGKAYKLVELEGEDHWLSLPQTRLRFLQEAVAFVQEHNPPG